MKGLSICLHSNRIFQSSKRDYFFILVFSYCLVATKYFAWILRTGKCVARCADQEYPHCRSTAYGIQLTKAISGTYGALSGAMMLIFDLVWDMVLSSDGRVRKVQICVLMWEDWFKEMLLKRPGSLSEACQKSIEPNDFVCPKKLLVVFELWIPRNDAYFYFWVVIRVDVVWSWCMLAGSWRVRRALSRNEFVQDFHGFSCAGLQSFFRWIMTKIPR